MATDALQRFLQHHDPDAFRELVLEHQNLVYGTCRRVLGNAPELDDAVQETFIKFAKRAHEIATSPAAWLHACARTTALDFRRAREPRRRKEIPLMLQEQQSAAAQAGDAAERADQASIVDSCLSELSDSDRDVVVSYFFVEKTQEEIARRTGVTKAAIKQRIDRALEALRVKFIRRGLVVPGLVAAFLTDLSAEAKVPPTLAKVLAGINPIAAASAKSSTLLVAAKSSSLAAKLLLPVVLSGLAAAGGGYWWKQAHQTAAESHRQQWDFSSGKPTDISESRGTWRWLPEGVMEVREDPFYGSIELPGLRLPIRMTLKEKAIQSDAPTDLLCMAGFQTHDFIGLFRNACPAITGLDDGSWHEVSCVITDRFLVEYCKGVMTSFQVHEHPAGALFLITRGHFLIDDLAIEEISPADLPDVREFLQAYEAIPREKRVGSVSVPSLPSKRTEPVRIDFWKRDSNSGSEVAP